MANTVFQYRVKVRHQIALRMRREKYGKELHSAKFNMVHIAGF